jgi:methionyl-tRNA formyltransferase
MGTPDFAVPSLRALHTKGHHIALVVTRPDQPKGRGRKILPPPIKTEATALNLECIQPKSIQSSEVEAQLKAIQPDFFIVVAFGRILGDNLLAIPANGTINIHASLLPKYRGPAPINWAIINGEKETGVTTMMMEKGLDTGDILLSIEEPITPEDTAASLHDRLALRGADLLIETLEAFAGGDLQPIAQNHDLATYAPLLNKTAGRIDWKKPAKVIEPFIRGMTPWPGAFTFHENTRLKIFRAAVLSKSVAADPGTVLESFPDELEVATGAGVLSILELQGPSAKRLAISDFLRGYRMVPGTILT